jgi:hypothetical protein
MERPFVHHMLIDHGFLIEADLNAGLGGAGVLVDVGQRFLHDPIDAKIDARRHRHHGSPRSRYETVKPAAALY